MKTLKEMSKDERRDVLVEVAEEIQDICEFEPPIRTDGMSEKELKSELEKAWKELLPEDKLSKKATSVFEELGCTGPALASTQQEEDIEDAEIVEEKEDDDDLVQQVNEAKQLSTLKKIAKSSDKFKSLRGKKFTFNGLKEALLEALSAEVAEEEAAAEVEEPRMEVSKPPQKKTTSPVEKKGEIPMAEYLDQVIEEGGEWGHLCEVAQTEIDRRELRTKYTPGGIRAHIKFRQGQDPKWLKSRKLEITDAGVKSL